jgi:hypothetical protein
MSRARVVTACATGVLLLTSVAAERTRTSRPAPVTREVIAVYLGTEGTDARSGMVEAVRDMKAALSRQAQTSGRHFISRGVSLEGSVSQGLRHLALFGAFDEVSVGGNWTNSSVVRYLGMDMGDHSRALIPQVVLLEREVRSDGPESLVVGPEREIGRYIGTRDIAGWAKNGAPLPK